MILFSLVTFPILPRYVSTSFLFIFSFLVCYDLLFTLLVVFASSQLTTGALSALSQCVSSFHSIFFHRYPFSSFRCYRLLSSLYLWCITISLSISLPYRCLMYLYHLVLSSLSTLPHDYFYFAIKNVNDKRKRHLAELYLHDVVLSENGMGAITRIPSLKRLFLVRIRGLTDPGVAKLSRMLHY